MKSPYVVVVIAWLVGLLAAAVITDLRSRRIPNLLVLTGTLTALLLHGLNLAMRDASLAGQGPLAPVAGLCAGGLLLMPLYLLRACGAGDVKLMAMAGAFVGPATASVAVLCTLIAGGLLSLLFMLGRGVAAQTLANLHFLLANRTQRNAGQALQIDPLARTAARLPYAVAITTGTLAALYLRSAA